MGKETCKLIKKKGWEKNMVQVRSREVELTQCRALFRNPQPSFSIVKSPGNWSHCPDGTPDGSVFHR